MNDSQKAEIERTLREVVVPLVHTDGGEVYLVRYEADDVHLHLAGACAGCPGSSLTTDGVIVPALTAAVPRARVVLTTGPRPPAGARRL